MEGVMENIIGVVGMILGIFGTVLATIVAIKQAKSDRMTFLADRIFDTTIPRELRLPFYEEYLARKGHGTAVKFWLLEGQKEQAAISK
jgi:hypothetical protein